MDLKSIYENKVKDAYKKFIQPFLTVLQNLEPDNAQAINDLKDKYYNDFMTFIKQSKKTGEGNNSNYQSPSFTNSADKIARDGKKFGIEPHSYAYNSNDLRINENQAVPPVAPTPVQNAPVQAQNTAPITTTTNTNTTPKKKKLFKLSAMKQLVDDNTFLKSKYEKLAQPTPDGGPEERFGYHWSEVIHNVLFNKYVKNDPNMFEKYKLIKIQKDQESEEAKRKKKEKTIDTATNSGVTTVTETTDTGVFVAGDGGGSPGGFPIMRGAFASDGNEWRLGAGLPDKTHKIVKDKLPKTHKINLKK